MTPLMFSLIPIPSGVDIERFLQFFPETVEDFQKMKLFKAYDFDFLSIRFVCNSWHFTFTSKTWSFRLNPNNTGIPGFFLFYHKRTPRFSQYVILTLNCTRRKFALKPITCAIELRASSILQVNNFYSKQVLNSFSTQAFGECTFIDFQSIMSCVAIPGRPFRFLLYDNI